MIHGASFLDVKQKLVAKFIILLTFFFFAIPALSVGAQFDPLAQVCEGRTDDASCNESSSAQPTGPNTPATNPVTTTIGNAIDVISIAVGAISVIIVIIAGVTMTLSAGDSAKVKSSRDAIIYAVVGLIVVGMSRLIITFLINRTT